MLIGGANRPSSFPGDKGQPESYESSEERGVQYAIRMPATGETWSLPVEQGITGRRIDHDPGPEELDLWAHSRQESAVTPHGQVKVMD